MQSGADRRAQRTSLAYPCRWDRRSPRRTSGVPFAGSRSPRFWIRTRNALSRVSPVKYFHLLNPRRLAWHDQTPVECSVQPKRLVKVRERGRPADPRRVPDRRGRETGRDRGLLVHGPRSKEGRGRTPEMRDTCAATGAPPVARVRAVTETGTNQAVFRQRQSSENWQAITDSVRRIR